MVINITEQQKELGYMPSYVYDNFCEMYEAYHELGGNGMATRMFEDVKKLEIRKG